MIIVGILAGILNYLIGFILFLPWLAIPVVPIFTLLDREKEVKLFGIGYVLGVIFVYYTSTDHIFSLLKTLK